MQTKTDSFSDEDYFASLERSLPDFFTRQQACVATGGILKPSTLANLDSGENKLPKKRIGKKVVYRKGDFIPWLRNILSYTPNVPPHARRTSSRANLSPIVSARQNDFDNFDETTYHLDPRKDSDYNYLVSQGFYGN